MDSEVDRLARDIVAAFKGIPADQRLLVAIAGPPGSGKSTLAYPLTSHINALLLGRAPEPSSTDLDTGLTSRPGDSDTPEQPGDEDVAICVGLDGWHYSRKELDGFDDPIEAHWRRGAAFTFNLPSYTSFLHSLRLPLTSNSTSDPTSASGSGSAPIPFPTFDHALKDPLISPAPVLPQHRIIVIEGLYTILDRPGWRTCAQMMDRRVFVECDREVCRRRIIRRNWEAGIVDDLKACEERVDASDMVNGDEVRQHQYQPTDVITPEDEPETHEK